MATHWSKIAEKPIPPSFGTFLWSNPCKFFDDSYLARNLNHWAIRLCIFHDPAFALLGTIPACDRQTDGQTDRHVAVAKTALA